MKKLILMLVIACVGLTTQAQIDSVSVKQVTEAERIIDKYSGKVTETVTDLVKGLKGPAEAVFTSVVKLQIAKGIVPLVILLIGLFFLWLYLKEYNRISTILNSDNAPSRYDTRHGVFNEGNLTIQLIVYGLGFIGFLIGFSAMFYDGILRLIAPEWYAIIELVNLVK